MFFPVNIQLFQSLVQAVVQQLLHILCWYGCKIESFFKLN